jgi:hypothetical protein
VPDIGDVRAEELARVFHRHYEEQAPVHGWDTQERSRVPWEEVPQENRMTMIATCRAVIDELGLEWQGSSSGFPSTVPAGWYAELLEDVGMAPADATPSERPHRWRIRAANGQHIASDEVFHDRANARRSVRAAFPGIPIRGE